MRAAVLDRKAQGVSEADESRQHAVPITVSQLHIGDLRLLLLLILMLHDGMRVNPMDFRRIDNACCTSMCQLCLLCEYNSTTHLHQAYSRPYARCPVKITSIQKKPLDYHTDKQI